METDVGQRAYRVATLQILPQTDNVYTVFNEGWHPAEIGEQNSQVEWQWTKKTATLSFKNPRKDSTLYLDLDNPGGHFRDPQRVQLSIGTAVLDTVTVTPGSRVRAAQNPSITAAAMGSDEMVDLKIQVDRTFVPALMTRAAARTRASWASACSTPLSFRTVDLRLGTLAICVAALLPRLAHRGMFLDGVTYASIARNLAEGRGRFWAPHYTATIYPAFHEHPPLGVLAPVAMVSPPRRPLVRRTRCTAWRRGRADCHLDGHHLACRPRRPRTHVTRIGCRSAVDGGAGGLLDDRWQSARTHGRCLR